MDDPLHRFDDRADDYARWRPTYPEAALDAMLEHGPRVAADIGAGTGIASRQLAERGLQVFAVEPSHAMREAGHGDGIEWRAAPAEATTLPDASCDLVLCSQSFHWFERDTALAEFHRILRPGGRLALIWNLRDRTDPFLAALSEISDGQPAHRSRKTAEAPLDDIKQFTNVRRLDFRNEQRLDWDGFLGRMMSISYFPRTGPEHEDTVARLRALHETWCDESGLVTYAYVTLLWLADKVAP